LCRRKPPHGEHTVAKAFRYTLAELYKYNAACMVTDDLARMFEVFQMKKNIIKSAPISFSIAIGLCTLLLGIGLWSLKPQQIANIEAERELTKTGTVTYDVERDPATGTVTVYKSYSNGKQITPPRAAAQ
jgi:hypothetical protein